MPKMKTKLLTMDSWATTSAAQDGIKLLKIIRDICHKKDSGTNATTILDLARMDKEMFLVHQGPTKLLSSYLSKFKGAVNVVESLDGTPWYHPAATKIVFDKIYGSLATFALAKASNSSDYHAAVTKVQHQYLAVLFFHCLSNEAHRDLKKKIHNDTLTGLDTVPRTYDKVLQLADQYKSSYQQCQPRGVQGGGIAFAQKGKLAAAAATAAAAAVAAAAASTDTPTNKKPHLVPGEKDAKGKMLPNSVGKKNCFNCRGNDHWVVNCPDLTTAQRKELTSMAHISLGDDKFEGIGFLQNESLNPRVIAACKTLDPQWLYLNSTLSIHQVFTDKHLDNLWLAGATLCTDCNAGTNFATKKG